MKIKFHFWVPVALILASMLGCTTQDAPFPSSPITIVVPWDAGGGTDSLARTLATEASKVLGVGVNVVNRSGGSGTTGHLYGMNARPDGYTVTMVTYELCSFKPLKRAQIDDTGFKALMQLNEDPAAITVHADSPFKTLGDFIEYAKQNPKKITIGNSGPGAVWHLGAVKLEQKADVEFTHIPHKGAKPAVVQLLGAHLDAVAVSPAEVLQYVEDGTLRCLGIMSKKRDPKMPDVPTFSESGYDLIHGTWRGLAVPKETPDEIVEALRQGFVQAAQTETFRKTASNLMLGLTYRDSESFAVFMRSESESISALIETLDL